MKVDIERLVTITVYCKLFPREEGGRGVKQPRLYQLMSDRTSEKNRINLTFVTVSGVKFIYLNDYSLNLLRLTYDQARELIDKELGTSQEKKEEKTNRTKGKARQPKDNDFYIE
jgi:hypothetical protein